MEIKQQWDAALYDHHHSFVARYGEDLMTILHPQPGEHILDLGCGTGHLAQQIADQGAAVTGMDSSAAMVEQARANYPTLAFQQGDGANFHFDDPFDAVFSNATLHWILTPERVVACVYDALKPGGRFVAEFGGKGNVATITNGIQDAIKVLGFAPLEGPLWYFPSPAEYATLLEAAGFRVILMTHFDRLTPLEGEHGMRNWIAMFGGPLLTHVPAEARTALIEEVERQLRPALYRDGQWYADYVRLRVAAVRTR